MERPIPAYYACYLARSISSHRSLYIGSTPHPVRRIRQHNGFTQGGANKTARNRAHDWSMVCLVAGFPSQIAALQFEWAWQHPHITRHIPNDIRISATRKVESMTRKGRRRTKVLMAGCYGLQERLKNLRLLLGIHSFSRWPLNVTFYARDVFDAWVRCDKLGHKHAAQVMLDESALPGAVAEADAIPTIAEDGTAATENDAVSKTKIKRGIETIDTTYMSMAPTLNHSTSVLAAAKMYPHTCAVCMQPITPHELNLVCTAAPCRMTAHQTCLARHFLAGENTVEKDAANETTTCENITGSNATLLPRGGPCPQCQAPLEWSDLARDLSLRTRGGDLLHKLDPNRIDDDLHDDENKDDFNDETPVRPRKNALDNKVSKKESRPRKTAAPEMIVIPDSDDFEICSNSR